MTMTTTQRRTQFAVYPQRNSSTRNGRVDKTAQPPCRQTESIDLLAQTRHSIPAWLHTKVTAEDIVEGLCSHVAEFASGQLAIVDCEVKRLRLRTKERRWSGITLVTVQSDNDSEPYEVALECAIIPPTAPVATTTETMQPFSSPQWRCYFPDSHLMLSKQPEQAKLSALAALTDPNATRGLLEQVLHESSNPAYHNVELHACRPQIMRYKPGSRCTILYHLEYEANSAEHAWPAVVVAKTHHGNKGKVAYDGMVALWQSTMRTSGAVTLAEPLAYLPDERILIQGPIREETTLKELIQEALDQCAEEGTTPPLDELFAYLRKGAIGLAELHHCDVRCGEVVTWADEAAEIYEDRSDLATVLPQFADFATTLLERLAQMAVEHPADALTAAHRSFRPAQVLLHQGNIGFIDFDGFCQSEPAMDLALFMTTIKNMARVKAKNFDNPEVDHSILDDAQLRTLALAEELCAFFLAEYEKHAPVSRARIAIWESVQLLSLVLGSWKKLKLDRLEYCYLLLQRHVERHGLA